MTMKPNNVAISPRTVLDQDPVELRDIIVRASDQAVLLPGLGVKWKHGSATVDEVAESISCLLTQAAEGFMHDDGIDQMQWGAVQQLTMAKELFASLHSTFLGLRVIAANLDSEEASA